MIHLKTYIHEKGEPVEGSYGLNYRGIMVRFPVGVKIWTVDISLLQLFLIASDAHLTYYTMRIEVPSPGAKTTKVSRSRKLEIHHNSPI
jgi:hypothetical protein